MRLFRAAVDCGLVRRMTAALAHRRPSLPRSRKTGIVSLDMMASLIVSNLNCVGDMIQS